MLTCSESSPSEPRLITLLTDFGLTDSYVAIMKGVIAQIAPSARVIDLTHQISPQDIHAASFQLGSAYGHFPPGTIHIVVVDPGVGGERGAIAFTQGSYTFVGPDNGVFTGVLTQELPQHSLQHSSQQHSSQQHSLQQHSSQQHSSQQHCVRLDNPTYWYSPTPSYTFHGRDIFAAAGAHLSQGVEIQALGSPQSRSTLNRLALQPWQPYAIGGQGCIQAIDHFGNLITNIPSTALEIGQTAAIDSNPKLTQGSRWSVHIQQRTVPGHRTFSDVERGTPVAYIGSHHWIELAINGGNAQEQWQAVVGDSVVLSIA